MSPLLFFLSVLVSSLSVYEVAGGTDLLHTGISRKEGILWDAEIQVLYGKTTNDLEATCRKSAFQLVKDGQGAVVDQQGAN